MPVTANPNQLFVNYMMQSNPQAGLDFQRQQMIAQQLTDAGNEPDMAPNTLANPGGYVINQSPYGMLGKALEKGIGGYMTGKNQAALAAALQGGQPSGVGTAPSSNGQSTPDLQPTLQETFNPYGKEQYSARVGSWYEGEKPIQQPDGTYSTYHAMQNKPNVNPAPINQPPSPPTSVVRPANGNQTQSQATGSNVLPSGQSDTAFSVYGDNKANDLPNTSQAQQNSFPTAMDKKPIIPEATNFDRFKPNPTNQPAWPSLPNTKQGVEQATNNQKAMQSGSQAMATAANNFKNESANLDDLIDTYSKIKSGTLTAQNPELMNKLAGWGVLPKEGVSDLAGVQRALNTHVLDVLNQMKDQNQSAGGGPPTRLFGSEINAMLEEGANPAIQPEGMFNILSKAKGLTNYGQDMVKGWQQIGGAGNRIAGGDSLLPDDYTQKFIDSHDTKDYVTAARSSIPAFKGMPQASNQSHSITPSGIKYQVIQ